MPTTINSAQTGSLLLFTAGDTVTITPTGSLDGSGISAGASAARATIAIDGALISDNVGIDLGAFDTDVYDDYGGNTIRIGATGSITAAGAYTIHLTSSGNTVINEGHLSSGMGSNVYLEGGNQSFTNSGTLTGGLAIFQDTYAGPGTPTSTIDNEGTMEGIVLRGGDVTVTNSGTLDDSYASLFGYGDAADTITIVNATTGVMTAGQFAINLPNTVHVTNRGILDGAISFGGGADYLFNTGQILRQDGFGTSVRMGDARDTYIGRGTVEGSVDMGDGNDFVRLVGQTTTVLGGTGTDTLVSNSDVLGSTDFETIRLFGAADADITADSTDSTLIGNMGDNTIRGGDGDDTLKGKAGADVLLGEGGEDSLFGGTGADVFMFEDIRGLSYYRGASDRIEDFVSGTDVIDLSGIDSFSTYLGTSSFSGFGTVEVRYRNASGDGEIQIDYDGDGTKDVVIMVTGVTSFTSADFVF